MDKATSSPKSSRNEEKTSMQILLNANTLDSKMRIIPKY